MLRLRSASRACLRAFLLASAVLLGGLVSAHASDTVTLTFTNVTQWNPANGITNNLNNGAGRFNWNVVTPAPTGTGVALVNGATKLWTFCIETTQNTASNITYEVRSDISTMPVPGGGMGTTKAGILQSLAHMMGSASFYSTYLAPVVQAAVWHIVQSTAGSEFTYPAISPNGEITTALVQSLLTNLQGVHSSTYTATTFFYGLASNNPGGKQDQIILVDGGGRGFGGNVVPVPAGVVMAGMGVVCLGGFNLLRRRKKVVTA